MSQRHRVVLRDLCDVVQYGYTASASSEAIGPKFLRITDIVPPLIDWAAVPFCAIEPAQREKFSVRHGDIVIARTGATVGYAKRLKRPPDAVFASYLVRLRLRSDVDGDFVGAVIESSEYKRFIAANAGGAAQPNANAQVLSSFAFDLPPFAEQRRIGALLSAYDDLIENNTRRIAILEEMARRIYEEWFVRFRFPGHADVRMVESELGLVPEGWRATSVGDVAAYINRGLAPKYDDTATCIVINQKCIRDQRLNLSEARKQSKPVPQDKAIQMGDVLINSTGVGTLGRVAQVLVPIDNCTVDTHVSIVRPGDNCDQDYFGLTLLAQQAHFEAQGVGSTGQTELSRSRITETLIVVPPLSLQRAFAEIVRPMRKLTMTLQNKNSNLRSTRALLLPKLISGELDVSHLPEPEAVAA